MTDNAACFQYYERGVQHVAPGCELAHTGLDVSILLWIALALLVLGAIGYLASAPKRIK